MIIRRGCCCIVEDILIELPPFRLDVENERLWRGRAIIPLNPKSFALLRYLVENHGRLITKRELLDAVWRDTFVTEGVLKTCIKEIRRALNDDADAPRFIETAHRRGYRFVGGQSPDSPETVLAARAPVRAPLLVGRDSVLDELAAHLEFAEQGQRRVVFVTGEPGAGKTTVIEAFLAAQANTGLLIVRGQCLEQYGEAEPFLPVLEAFGQLSVPACRSKFIEILHTHAPTWLVQMPALIAREERERLQKELFGATRQRMMREMTDGLDALSAETPFVLALEDLHWCDPSTVDLITSLARRVNPARFMLLGTYRPVEIALSRHPLREVTQDLLSRRLCHNVALDCLSEASIEEYLTARFKVADLLADRATLARRLHRHTGGNPLFLVNLVDYLEARDALNMPDVQIGLPETLRQMITRQVERLKETDQRMIEAGAVAGADFDAAAVATAVGITSDLVEECCDELVAKGMFLKKAEHPGGVRSRSLARYSFIHALYRECLYERIQASRRQRWHQAIGEWQEAGGMDPAELASELAVHFEASGDLHRAIHYLKLAAAGAAARFAFVEGRQCLDRAAKLVQSLPAPERGMLELELFDQRRMFRAAGAITPDQSEMFEAMAGKARDLGRPDLEIKLLVEAGEMLLWLDRHHMCEVLDRARELSTVIDDPLLRATAQAVRAMWRLYLFGEPRGLLDEFLEAMAVIEASKNPSLVAQFKWKYSALLLEDSQYEAAYQVAAEGAEVSKVAGQMYDYLASHYGIHWSLMHQGRWGEGLALLRDCCELCLKNDAREPVALFQAQRALFSIEMLDFEGAFAITRPLWEQLKDLPGHTFGHMLGAIVLAHSLTGLGDFQESTKIFQEFLERVQRDRFILEPRMQKYLWTGLANNWFIQGNFDEARQATARVLPLCRELRDRTFLTQCHNLLAEIDEVEGKRQDARQHISEALKILDSEGPCILPAARRVYRSASRLLDDGPGFRERAEGVIEALGASLLDHPQLQRKFVDRARSCGNEAGGGA